MYKIVVRDREAGNVIETVKSKEEGYKLIEEFENQDKADDNFVEDFYEVAVINDGNSVIIYHENIIKLTEDGNYRPNTLIINDELCSMEIYLSHHGYNWKTSASGNILYYESESGKNYTIPQSFLMNPFMFELRELKTLSWLTQAAFAEAIGVPRRTFEDWIAGKHTPSKFVQESVIDKAIKLIK